MLLLLKLNYYSVCTYVKEKKSATLDKRNFYYLYGTEQTNLQERHLSGKLIY